MSDVVIDDPWQARLDRLRRLLPFPLLVVATVAALVVPSHPHRHVSAAGLTLAGAAAIWSVAVNARLRPDSSALWRLVAFGVHIALAGVLVWVNLWYGVFAYSGFLLAYPLGARWRTAGFAVTALIVSASLSGGYPSGRAGQSFSYLLIAAVVLALVLTSASITNRALEQNQQRGRMIDELAEAKRRLETSMAENAELHEQLLMQAREAGIVEERQRLAGEIHDTLAQGLAGIIAQLEAAEHTRGHPSESARHIHQARSLARSSLTEARRSVRALRPEQLDDATLPEAISMLARTWSDQARIAAQLDTTGTPMRADTDTEAAVFRVAQEALSNVAKHAKASEVHLTLTYLDDTLLLDVVDDGVGFDPTIEAGGYGLLSMHKRLCRVRGIADRRIRSRLGHDPERDRAARRTASGRSMTPIRLLIVDDHPIMRDGLRGVFTGDADFEVVGEAADGAEAVRQAQRVEVDVILMDLRMPAMGGVEAITRLRELGHPARVLVLTTYDTDRDVLPAIEAGATGYLLKDAPRDELIGAVRAAHAGQSILAPAVAGAVLGRTGARNLDALSPREIEVLRLVADGATNQTAARHLLISETTIKTHLLHIYAKLGVRDRAAAVATAYRRGLLG